MSIILPLLVVFSCFFHDSVNVNSEIKRINSLSRLLIELEKTIVTILFFAVQESTEHSLCLEQYLAVCIALMNNKCSHTFVMYLMHMK